MYFIRQGYTELWLTLSSDKVLGILDSGYLEDYYGTDSQVTLYNVATDFRTPVLMNEIVDATPNIPHDVFTGFVDLSELPNGLYRIEGRVRDLTGHYTVLSEVQNPDVNETVRMLELLLTDTDVTINMQGEATIVLGTSWKAEMTKGSSNSPAMEFISFPAELVTNVSFVTSMENESETTT